MHSASVEHVEIYRDRDEPVKARLAGPQLPIGKTVLIVILFLFSGSNIILPILQHEPPYRPLTATSVNGEGVVAPDAIDVEGGKAANLALGLIVLFLVASQGDKVLALAMKSPLLTTLGAFGVLSTFWSVVPAISFRRGIFLLLSTLVAYYFTVKYKPEEQMKMMTLIGAMAALGTILVSVFLPEYGVDQIYHLGEWRGFYMQKNICAGAMLLFATPLFGLKPPSSLRLLFTIYGLGVLFVLVMTQCRNGWVVAIVVTLLMIVLRLLSRFQAEDRRTLFVIGVLLTPVCAWILWAVSGTLLSMLGRDATFTGRTGIWETAVAGIAARPALGYGYQAFWIALYGGPVGTHAHNGFLQLGLDLGLIGVALFLLSLLMAIRDVSTCLRSDRPVYVDWYIAIIMVVVFFSMSEPFLVTDRTLTWVLYVVACVGLRRTAQQLRRKDPLPLPSRATAAPRLWDAHWAARAD